MSEYTALHFESELGKVHRHVRAITDKGAMGTCQNCRQKWPCETMGIVFECVELARNWQEKVPNGRTIEQAREILVGLVFEGSDKDEPEGTRYTTMSHTLVAMLYSLLGEA